MTTLSWVTVGCYVSCQFDPWCSKPDTHRLVTHQQFCIKNSNTHFSWLHLCQEYPCTLFQLFSATMVPPDPAGANDRVGLVKEGHLPSMAPLPMLLLGGRGLRWFHVQWQSLYRTPLCFSYPYWAPLIQVPKKRSRCLATGASTSVN